MSDSSQEATAPRNETAAESDGDVSVRGGKRPVLERWVPHLADSIRKTSFWTAIVLPVCYVPLLAFGLGSRLESSVFVFLLGCNLLALYVGHSYRG